MRTLMADETEALEAEASPSPGASAIKGAPLVESLPRDHSAAEFND